MTVADTEVSFIATHLMERWSTVMKLHLASRMSPDIAVTPTGSLSTGWACKTSHDQAVQHAGQSWADYMDDLEDRQLSQRRKRQRRAGVALAFIVLAVLLVSL